jgi:hypothetical protein
MSLREVRKELIAPIGDRCGEVGAINYLERENRVGMILTEAL